MFSNIKYNLYEILNVSQESDENIIKKSYLKLIKKFHPDKNNKLEEEIYFHIMYANQILTNKVLRNKYNEFIKETIDFNNLKCESNKNLKNNISEADSLILFNRKVNEQNEKHGYNINFTLNNDLKREEFVIEKEINVKDIKDFNSIFLKKKINGSLKDQIVEYKGEPMEISTYLDNNNYTFINNIEKLYIEDNYGNNSLEIAFSLQPFTNI